jgi:Rod binding domain-containing protein
MSVTAAGAAQPGSGCHAPSSELRRLCHEMEAVFLRQLFAAMRSSISQDESLTSSPEQGLFTAMLDDQLASETAGKMGPRGIGEALYRQLSRRLPAEDGTCPTPEK